MKKIIIVVILFVFYFFQLNAQNAPDFAWAKNITSDLTNNIISQVIAVDNDGNSYRAFQYISHSYNLDGIQVTSPLPNSSGNIYGYFSKYDENNNIMWAISFTNVMLNSYSNKILIDDYGDIYLYGNYRTNTHYLAYLGDSLLTDNTIPSPDNSPVSNGVFLAKFKNTGEILWIKRNELHPSSASNILSNSISLSFNQDNNIQIVGTYQGSISFVPGDTLFASDQNESNPFYALYAPSGEVLQSRRLSGGIYPHQYSPVTGIETFETDASGKIYRLLNGNTYKKLFRYDSHGNFIDSLIIDVSSTGNELRLSGFAVSPSGDVYIGGYFSGNLTVGNFYYPHYGSGQDHCQGFIFKLASPTYHIAWADTVKALKTTSLDILKTDELGNVYATGQYSDFQENASSFRKYTASGDLLWDKPVTGLTTPQILYTGFAVIEGLALTQNGGNIWISGKYSRNIYFSPNDHFTTPALNSYNGFLAQYGICNTPKPTIDYPLSTQLCGNQDSIILSATIDNSWNGTYYWSTPNGLIAVGSSNSFVELTVGQIGKYSLIFQEDEECYGKSQEIWVTKSSLPDTAITVQNNTLTAIDTTQGLTYQWIDCLNNNAPISGANNPIFEPTVNGEYAVILTTPNGCSDTSACHIINTLGIQNNPELDKQITIYPNPTSDKVTIKTGLEVDKLTVLDLQGKKLISSKSKEIDLSSLSSGVYLIKVRLSNSEIWTSKVIKKW